MFRCASCDKINEQSWLCVYCECTILLEFTPKEEHIDLNFLEFEQKYPIPDDNDFDNDNLMTCPKCHIKLEIVEINCGVFRCGQIVHGFVNPHASLEEIERLKQTGMWVAGCSAPLRYNTTNKSLSVIYTANNELDYKS